jgi:hypothetical protein
MQREDAFGLGFLGRLSDQRREGWVGVKRDDFDTCVRRARRT